MSEHTPHSLPAPHTAAPAGPHWAPPRAVSAVNALRRFSLRPVDSVLARYGSRYAPAFLRRHAATCAVLCVVASLLLAWWWSHQFLPGRYATLWSPYFFGPMGWVAAAFISLLCYRQLPPSGEAPPASHTMILGIAALVGCFQIAVQLIVGILADFGYSPFAHTPRWLLINLLFAGGPLLAFEVARATILRATGQRYLFLILIATAIGLAALHFNETQFRESGLMGQTKFWGSLFLPICALGLIAGFFALYGGISAALLVTAPSAIFLYYSPVLPVAPWTIIALAGVAGPAVGLWVADSLFEDAESEPEPQEESRGRFSTPSIAWVMTSVTGLLIFWFSFGFFGYRPAFVPTHSMEPLINQGDLVITQPVNPDTLKVGDIVSYEATTGQLVLHRIIEIRTGESGDREFIMQGDNNPVSDFYPVAKEQIKGKLLYDVPKVGWFPLKFNQFIEDFR